jgi:hypothetical protein
VKIRTDQKIAVGGVLFLVAGYYGWQLFAASQVDQINFPQLRPAKVNLIGIDAGKGYKIIVSNEVAQLVQVAVSEEGFETGKMDENEQEIEKGPKVPLREMLESMAGSEESLGVLVTKLNPNLNAMAQDLPAVQVVWDAADIQKATNGDAVLRDKLEKDLNMKLDGTPLEEIRPSSIANGIVVRAYIPIEVRVDGKLTIMKAPILMPFKARFITQVYAAYSNIFNPSKDMILGRYMEKKSELQPGNKEDLKRSLLDRIDEKALAERYADKPTRVLANARVVATDLHFTNATAVEATGAGGKRVSDIRINLTDEGRKRLWQYSRRYKNQQLLFMQDNGVAIAAPRIRQELADGEITIRQVQNVGLAKDAVDLINSLKSKS